MGERERLRYQSDLSDPRWRQRAAEIRHLAGRRCERCGEERLTLNVHHLLYIPGHRAWEYPDELLECLCSRCHWNEHTDPVMLAIFGLVADAWGPIP